MTCSPEANAPRPTAPARNVAWGFVPSLIVAAAVLTGVGWLLETRIPAEIEEYPSICALAHKIIAEGLAQAVEPGVTTTADLEWWYRERVRELKLRTWFQPMVSVQRAGQDQDGSFATDPGETIICRGDLIHLDFGIEYLGLHTDTQHHAYVLGEGESEAPEGLSRGLEIGNRLFELPGLVVQNTTQMVTPG